MKKYQAFISYRHSDFSRHKVVAVENALKKYAKPFWKPFIRLFRDEKEMPTGSNLAASINFAFDLFACPPVLPLILTVQGEMLQRSELAIQTSKNSIMEVEKFWFLKYN
jgi:hypothetical protein